MVKYIYENSSQYQELYVVQIKFTKVATKFQESDFVIQEKNVAILSDFTEIKKYEINAEEKREKKVRDVRYVTLNLKHLLSSEDEKFKQELLQEINSILTK